MVSTPIGNLEDITVRAITTLREVDVIACEDTRKTRTLLRRWNIATRLISLHRFSESRKTQTILHHLEQGRNVALVSDAGTPVISDPGSRLVQATRDAGFTVTPVPGPSSVLAALSVSGMDGSTFLCLGFVPKKTDQRTQFLERIEAADCVTVFFETPLRVKATLRLAAQVIGERRMSLLRELTKLHEEILPGTATSILAELEKRPSVKGEIVIVVEGRSTSAPAMDVSTAVKILAAEGLSGKRLAEEAHTRFGIRKGDAYKAFLSLKE